jgi:hypothetical protein
VLAPAGYRGGNTVFHWSELISGLGELTEGLGLETFWDWFTVFCFAGLATLLLQRSSEEQPRDKLWQYAPPAIGLAVANYVGNDEIHWLAAVIMVGVAIYVYIVLRPQLPKV